MPCRATAVPVVDGVHLYSSCWCTAVEYRVSCCCGLLLFTGALVIAVCTTSVFEVFLLSPPIGADRLRIITMPFASRLRPPCPTDPFRIQVVIFNPGFPWYLTTIRVVGATPVLVELAGPDFAPDMEKVRVLSPRVARNTTTG